MDTVSRRAYRFIAAPRARCIARTSSPGARLVIVIAVIAFALTGCATKRAMMPTPVIYTGENARPLFTELSIDGRQPSLDLLFITDRALADQAEDLSYTADRSRSIGFGSAMIEFGKDASWDVLVKESTATHRVRPLQLELGTTTELGRFPAIPYEVAVAPDGIDVYPPSSRRTKRQSSSCRPRLGGGSLTRAARKSCCSCTATTPVSRVPR